MMYPKKQKRPRKGISAKYLLSLWSKVVRKEASGQCCLCGVSYNVQGHHIIRRGIYRHVGWFSLDNGIALCFECHLNGVHSMHFPTVQKFQEKIDQWLIKKGTTYELLYLQCKSRKVDLGLSCILLKQLLVKS